MKYLSFILLLLHGTLFVAAQPNSLVQRRSSIPFTFIEYNCENLFDIQHDTLKNDNEFLPDSNRRWTYSRYKRKVNDIGRVIHQCGGDAKDWRLPDMIAMLEVENDSVMTMLTRRSMLASAGYRYVMTQSDDERGIDVALLYNPLTTRLLSYESIRVDYKPKTARPTRDILHATMLLRTDDTLHVFAVHAPSRRGGRRSSEPYRIHIVNKVLHVTDSIFSQSPNAKIIICGDFNDYSYNKSIKLIRAARFDEPSQYAKGKWHPSEVVGTYRYQGVWDSLDHIFISPSLSPTLSHCYIMDAPWMLDGQPGTLQPNRTYRGTAYNAGVSDHLPLVMELNF